MRNIKEINTTLAGFLLVIWFFANLWLYSKNTNNLKQDIYKTYEQYNKILETTLVNNLRKVISGEEINNFSIDLIYRTEVSHNKNDHNFLVKITAHSIEIQNVRNKVVIDLISLKEYFKDLLPQEFIYSINLANTFILNQDSAKGRLETKLEYDLGNHLMLRLELAVSDLYFLKKYNKILLEQVYFALIFFVFNAYILWVNMRLKQKSTNSIISLRTDLTNTQNNLYDLKKAINVQKIVNNSFIKKATEIYQEKMGYKNNNILLFPLTLIDQSNSKINLKKLQELVQSYFCGLYDNIKVNILTEIEYAHYHIGSTALNQLIISIINTIATIILSQTDRTREIKIIFAREFIQFEFVSLSLCLEKLGKIAKITQDGCRDMFLLDFDKIRLSLDQHEISYTLDSKGNTNVFKLRFLQHHVRQNENVIEFTAKK